MNNTKLINEKLIFAFRWSVLSSIKMRSKVNIVGLTYLCAYYVCMYVCNILDLNYLCNVLEFYIFLVKNLLMSQSRTQHVTTNQNHFVLLLIFYEFNILYLENSQSLLLQFQYFRNTIKLHVQIFLRMNTWMFETCRRI